MADKKTIEQKLAQFFDNCIRQSWEGQDMEGGEIQDMAKALGLIQSEPFDPEKHDASDCEFDIAPGEDWFTIVPAVVALVNAAEAKEKS